MKLHSSKKKLSSTSTQQHEFAAHLDDESAYANMKNNSPLPFFLTKIKVDNAK
jgi:hypothetical protein